MAEGPWIALAGILVSGIISGLALWLTFRERRASYRQTLYSKQLEGYEQIIEVVSEARNAAYNFDFCLEMNWTDECLNEADNKLQAARNKLRIMQEKWVVFLPTKVQKRLDAFDLAILMMASAWMYEKDENGKPIVDQKRINKIRETYIPLIEIIRESLGTDPLSHETLNLIGKAPSPPKAVQREKKLNNHAPAKRS